MKLDDAHQQIADLKAWQTAALERFPDLAVDPVVLAARKLVSKQFSDDRQMVADIMAGKKDELVPMKVAVEALSSVMV